MASLRFYIRRLKRIISTPTFQLVAILSAVFLAVRWVLQHNHDGEDAPGPVAFPIKNVEDKSIDWSKLYYVQYVTSPEYLCNALMVWSEIEEIGSRAQRLMMYPSHWDPDEIDDTSPTQDYTPVARLLRQARTSYYVKLHPVSVLHQNSSAQAMWSDSYTKLLAFNLTQFDRVLAIDSNSRVMKNMDALFLLPPADVAMPYVYWGEPTGWGYSSQLLLLTPSIETFDKVQSAIQSAAADEYDMDILKKLFKSHILRIPQKPYNLLSGEFRRTNHDAYLSSRSNPAIFHPSQKWDPEVAVSTAAYLHFSDWPIPKPWMRASQSILNTHMPKCRQSEWFGATDCRDRNIWKQLYFDFALRRVNVCGAGFELRSEELSPDSVYRHGKWYHPDEV